MLDILIIGNGPAGAAAAKACVGRDLRVGVLAPEADADWPNNYGAWVDELEPLGLSDCFERTWSRFAAFPDAQTERRIARAYGRLDNARLKAALTDPRVTVIVGAAATVAHTEHSSTVTTHCGQTFDARLVIDATGHNPVLAQRQPGRTLGWQTAYGLDLEVDSHPFDLDTAVFMDFRPSGDRPDPLSTFLYALPLSPTRIFVEETSLIARTAPPFDFLRDRLDDRLEQMGVTVRRVIERERCLFPMGAPLPRIPQRVVAFGGAASMVHPATGYLLARTLRAADRVARAAQLSLAETPTGEALSRSVWEAVWPADHLRTRAFHLFGASVVCDLGAEETRSFFGAFFDMPPTSQQLYLDGESAPKDVIAVMTHMFNEADFSMKRRLMSAGIGPQGASLVRSLVA